MNLIARISAIVLSVATVIFGLSTPALAHPADHFEWNDNHWLCSQGCDINGRSNYHAFWQSILWADAQLATCQVDGYFGPNTAAATRQYQRYYGLSVDGVVGPNTWDEADNWTRVYPNGNRYYYGSVHDLNIAVIGGVTQFEPPYNDLWDYVDTWHVWTMTYKC